MKEGQSLLDWAETFVEKQEKRHCQELLNLAQCTQSEKQKTAIMNVLFEELQRINPNAEHKYQAEV